MINESIVKLIVDFRTGDSEDGVISVIFPGASPTVMDNDEYDYPFTTKMTL
jgi:hypothetical protein